MSAGDVFPPQVLELIHLRYLSLRTSGEIPAAISKLENLQTLIIHACLSLGSYLPVDIWKMPQLRHLSFMESYMLLDPADGSTLPLKNLQTLAHITSSACRENILKMIPNLKILGITVSGYEEMHHCLQHWITESDHFPRLKHLVLQQCKYLEEIPDVIGEIPTLEVIEVDKRNESLVKSAKQIQEDQQSYGNDVLQVRGI